ncbi:MAG: hypothetical protein RL487_823 [Actinomycetota bacterium]
MPRNFNQDQEPIRRLGGEQEFIVDNTGRERLARRWSPGEGIWHYTRIGLAYFRRRRVEMIVEIPARIEGQRENGTFYTRYDMVPIANIGIGKLQVPEHLTAIERERLVKSRILDELHMRTRDGDPVIYEYSSEVWFLDDSRPWKISTMTTQPGADGRPDVQVAMDRPLRQLPCTSDVLKSGDFIPEAFEEGDNCVARQLAAALPMDLWDVENILGQHFPLWREVGVSSSQVVQLCGEVFRRPCWVVLGHALVHAYRPPGVRPHHKGLAWAIVGSHMYMYRDCRTVCQLKVTEPSRPLRKSLPREPAPQDVVAWVPWRGEFEAGHYYANDLDQVRVEFLETGRNPRVTMLSASQIAKLTYVLTPHDGGEGEVVVHRWSEFATDIQDFLDVLRRDYGCEVDYRGESLAGVTRRVLAKLMKLKRTALTEAQKADICAEQNCLCACCGGFVEQDDRQFDHLVPLRDLTLRRQELLQLVCGSCHAEKTAAEPRCDRDPLLSAFSPLAFEAYVLSPQLPQLQFRANVPRGLGGELHEVDVRRCRRMALYHSDVPLFSVLDNIVEAEAGELYDLQFVDRKTTWRGPGTLLSLLPYQGPAWYPRVAVQFLLHHGKITWSDVKFGFSATSRLPVGALRKPLDIIDDAWERCGKAWLAKQAVNALIGMYGCRPKSVWRCKSSTRLLETSGADRTSVVHYGGDKTMIDYFFETNLVTNGSHRVLYDIAVATEHVRVAEQLYILQRLGVPQRNVLYVKTDAVCYQASPKLTRGLRDVEKTTLRDLHKLRSTYEPAEKGMKMNRLNELTAKTPVEDDRLAFRTQPGTGLMGDYPLPVITEARTLSLPRWHDVSPEAGEQLALAGEGLFVRGIAGTGKTHYAREIIDALRGDNKKVCVLAKTHVATRNAEGDCTLDRFARRYVAQGTCPYDVLVIDEISQVDVALLVDLGKCAMLGKQIIVIGDFNQFTPIADQWKGSVVPDGAAENSQFLKALCPHRVTLTENQRSDPELFKWYSSLVDDGPRASLDLPKILEEAAARFPRLPGRCRWNLVMSHTRRVSLNRLLNEAEAKQHDAVFIPKPECPSSLNEPQDMYLWPGLLLVGCLRSGPVQNGCFYEVEAVDKTHVALKDGPTLTHAAAARHLRLTYALTYAAVQGLTLDGRVRLWDTRSPHFTRRHLFVAMSRATAAANLEIA